ncbi:hypothetical protein AB833_00900 [Chromatiales bacterium (ex Bugula neritina AB1)]|nr:hypothetical protein AB833_00900 [Chromatiales bacterium (ex Bugula neritina AB1)]
MIDGFLVKKLVSVLVHLIPGALILMLIGLIARCRVPRLSNLITVALCVALTAASSPVVSNYFISNLESRFPVLQTAPEDTSLILVLGAGHNYAEDRPSNSLLTATALSRIVEGARLWKTRPDARLAVSGAHFGSPVSHAQVMKDMAIQLGVDGDKIITFDNTLDTADEISKAMETLQKNITPAARDSEIINKPENLPGGRLLVVSSASHLPRAAKMLDYTGTLYSVAPTDFLADNYPWYLLNGGALANLDRSFHEWVGMAWLWLVHRVSR